MRYIAMGAASAALAAATLVGAGAPAQALPPIAVGNLVNVQITNVLNNNEVAVQIPINAAANICGVSVTALAQDLVQDGTAECRSRSGNRDLVITQ